MRKRSRTAAVVLGAGAVLVTMHLAPSAARAQSAGPVLCDRVAADPNDPDKPKDIAGVAAIARGDIPIAIRFCRIAATSSRRALFELGRAYAANGQTGEALTAYRRAAEKGSTSAMVELGVMYGTGVGVAKDTVQARQLFERAARGGNPRGITNLAALAGAGGASADPVKARALLQTAVQANSAEAEYQLGLMTADGVGGPKDDVAARSLFEKAAAQDHPGALERMGAFAASGRGGRRDTAAAKAYYQKAAALGNEAAKAALKRLECPYQIKDKQGHFVTNLCF